MNKLRFYLFTLLFFSLSLVLRSQSVKSIVKNIKKNQKSYKAYELKYESNFKFFDHSDTDFYYVHQKAKHSLGAMDLGWELKTNPKDTIFNAYDARQIVYKSNYANIYYLSTLKESVKQFTYQKNNLTYLPLRYKIDAKEFELAGISEQYYILKETDSSKDETLDIASTMLTILHINKQTYFIDTFQQWFWMTGQVQYNKLVLKSIQRLNKAEVKTLEKEVDSLQSRLKSFVNGDSLWKANRKEEKKLIEKGDSLPLFKAKVYATNDSFFFYVPMDSIVILDFFYTSCGPCIAAIPHLKELDSLYKNKGVAVMGINPMKNDIPRLERFVKYHGINYPILLVENDVARKQFGILGYPTLLIIKNNQIIFQQQGFSKELKDVIIKELNQHIKK
jgi:thiol-disulfide isomerase/thioredoxin